MINIIIGLTGRFEQSLSQGRTMLDKQKYGPWAIVTGASRGIGKAFAEQLAAEGFNIVLLARNRSLLTSVEAGLRRDHGIETRVVVADLEDYGGLSDLLDSHTADLDIGLLIANAAVSQFAQMYRASPAETVSMLRVNVVSMAVLCQYFARRLVARGRGGILPVSSNGAYCMLPNQANYAASKAFVAHFGEILHVELKARNVDVTVLFPPLVDTDMIGELQQRREWNFEKMPFGFGVKARPASVAAAALRGLGRSARVHPPRASAIFMWIVRRLPDGLRIAMFDYIFSKAVDVENRWW